MARLPSLRGTGSPPASSPLAGESCWLSVGARSLPVSAGKGPHGWPARTAEQSRAEQGSENKVGRLTKFPIERQDEMLSFSLSQDVVHSLYRFRFTLCLRQEKGRGERRFYFWQTTAYLPQPHSRRPWITNSPAMGLCTTATCSTVWLSMFKGVLTEALQPGAADEMLRDPPLGTSE